MPTLSERRHMLMVPRVFTCGVVIYTNGNDGTLHFPAEAIRQAIIAQLPPGTGVGQVTATDHGVYREEPRDTHA